MVTKAEIEAGKSAAGGWTRAQLAKWGVPWPPPKGWKKRLMRESQGKRSFVPRAKKTAGHGKAYGDLYYQAGQHMRSIKNEDV